MKILCTGDWHLRETNPKYRIDDFKQALKNKLTFIQIMYQDHDCQLLLQPGDFFDYADRVSYSMLAEWLTYFKNWPQILTIFGQHDLKNHSLENKNIPASVFETTDIYQILPYFGMKHSFDDVTVYGCSFGEQIIYPKNKDHFNVLVIHKMIIQSKKLWDGQTEYSIAKTLLKKYGYNLIVSGDNHQQFVETYEDKTLINAGSLMRTAKNQQEHQPAIYIFDTDELTYERIPIPCESFDTVFNIHQIEKEKHIKQELTDLVAAFKDRFSASLDFMKNLDQLKKEADADTLEILKEVFNE